MKASGLTATILLAGLVHCSVLAGDVQLLYSTYFGGSMDSIGGAVCVDSNGYVYVAGHTRSADFPICNALQTNIASSDAEDIVFAKFSPSCSNLIFSSYLGGTGVDQCFGLKVDSSGHLYLYGITSSTNFPTTTTAIQKTNKGGYDLVVTKISPDGQSLVYSTYIGGSANDRLQVAINTMALDSIGSVYITARSDSADFPTTNAFQASHNAEWGDAVVAKVSPDGASLMYSTYLGGSNWQYGVGIALDATGSAYVVGVTASDDFPTTNAFQSTFISSGGPVHDAYSSTNMAFVSKFSPDGRSLVYSTYLGGTGAEIAQGIAVDGAGCAYVVGRTSSSDFPTNHAFQGICGGDFDGFVTKFAPDGGSLIYSTYLGGEFHDWPFAIALDSDGAAHVAGRTSLGEGALFPAVNAYQSTPGGGMMDAFLAKLSPDGASLVFSTFLGGNNNDLAFGVAVDSANNAYVVGSTLSTSFPTQKPYQGSLAGNFDIFAAKLAFDLPEMFVLSPAGAVVANGEAASADNETDFGSVSMGCSLTNTFSVTNSGNTVLHITGVATSGTDAASFEIRGCPGSIEAGGMYSFTIVFAPQAGGPLSAAMSFVNNDVDSPYVINLRGYGTGGGISLETNSLTFAGVYGGCSPSDQFIRVTNIGTNSFTCGNTQTYGSGPSGWLTVRPSGGPVAAAGSVTLTNAVDLAELGAGTYYATNIMTAADATNSPQVYTVALTVNKAYQTITFPNPGPQIATNTLVLAATGGASGNPVTFAVVSGPAMLSEGTNLSFTGAGSVSIAAAQSGNADYNPAPAITNAFTVTAALPIVGSPLATNITATTARLGGEVTKTSGAPVNERGICWSLTSGFADEAGTKVSETGNFGTGVFSIAVSGLVPGRSNYFKAFAANIIGTNYSEQGGYLTRPDAPCSLAPTNATAISFFANWTVPFGADGCFLDVSEMNDFDDYLPGYSNLPVGLTQTMEIVDSTPDTVCYYRLRAENAAGVSSNSGVITVAKVLPWPDNGVTITNRRPTFYWAAVDGATWYRLWINRNGTNYNTMWLQGVTSWTSGSDMKGGSYEWWVQSWNDITKNGPWSVRAAFQVPVRVPGKATLLAPSGFVETETPVFAWASVSNASWHHLWVNRNSKPVYLQWVQSQTNHTAATNLYFGSYKWWVMTWSIDGSGPWSDPLEYSYGVPVLMGPSGPVAGTRRPEFTWISSAGTLSSRFWLNKAGRKYEDRWIVGTNWIPSADLPYGQYEWWVLGRDQSEDSKWSASKSFDIGMAVPVEPTGVLAGSPTELKWNDTGSADATWYHLWMNRDGVEYWQKWVTKSDTFDAGGGERTYALPMTLPLGSYTWWTRTWNDSGYSRWSSPLSFDLAP